MIFFSVHIYVSNSFCIYGSYGHFCLSLNYSELQRKMPLDKSEDVSFLYVINTYKAMDMK